ncbi:uncharacterized protein LOC109721629 [Ananas comosus]|uniref:Uncharacterized protein LOC109721629 n=1 Tax=Ananas comosus TaxID=4615 RepID=A0A6P5GAR9_ANACO|nr:uncharacterized protein LOC109721629 [Ananas comosus]
MATEFDDSEWILADADDDDGDGDGDWVVTDGDEGSVSGVFLPSPSKPLLHRGGRGGAAAATFAAFGRRSLPIPDPSLSFLPPSLSVASSSRGLLLLRGPWSSYYVCNPANAQWGPVPRPPRPHSLASPPPDLALVADPSPSPHFHLVCAFRTLDGEYRFETFSSAAGGWRSSSAAPVSALVPGSAVAAAGAAYWRTSKPEILAFDPVSGAARLLPAPPGCGDCGARWQLGEAAGRLCCARVARAAVDLLALGPSDRWDLLGSYALSIAGEGGDEATGLSSGIGGPEPLVCREAPRPLRFESGNLEVVLWVDGRIVAVDLKAGCLRPLRFEGVAPDSEGDYVAYVNTLGPAVPGGA